jgi:SSS family solute:Na+ symporter
VPLTSNLSILDNSFILLYFIVVLAIGLVVARKKESTVKEYFLAGKNLGWLVIGTSLFATNISSEHLVGLAGASSVHGFSVGHFEWLAAIILIFLGWIIAPIFLKANVNTVPQFFGKRFDDRSRIYLTIVSIATYLFTKIAVTLIAGGLVLREVFGWDVYTSTILIVLLTGIYTVIGGMNSVVYTQVFQTVILVLGAVLLSVFGLLEVGGFSSLVDKLPASYFHISKPFSDSNLPWTGILLGAPIIGIWYWCADQYTIQRILSAKGIKDARKGTVLASILKIIPIFFFIIPGLVAAVMYPNIKGDSAYSLLVTGGLLPTGIKGIVIAGFFAALMSSLSSSFNSTASLFTLDIYSMRKRVVSENEAVLVGRLSTMILIIITLLIIPLLKYIETHIYISLQALQAFIVPPIVSVFLFGVFWEKASSRGAIRALMIGGFIGLLKILVTNIDESIINEIFLLNSFNDLNYLHFAFLLFVFSSSIIILYSLIDAKKQDILRNSNELFANIDENERQIAVSTNYKHMSNTVSNFSKSKDKIIQ